MVEIKDVTISKVTDKKPVYLRKETVDALRKDLGWREKDVFGVVVSSVGGELIVTAQEDAVEIKIFRNQDQAMEELGPMNLPESPARVAAVPVLTAPSSPEKQRPGKQLIQTHDESTLEKWIEGRLVICEQNYYVLKRK